MNRILQNFLANNNLFVILYLNLVGVYSIYYVITKPTDLLYYFMIAVCFILMKIIGVEAGYHRLFSHRAFKTSRFYKCLMLLFATISGQGSPIVWAGLHRYNHHGHADKDKDPHTPMHGFWHSYIFWMFKVTEKSINIRSITDLLKDKDIIFFHKHSTKIFCLVHILVFLVDKDLWIYGLSLPAFLTLHSFCLQTSVLHCGSFGYKNFVTHDNSKNIPWLFLFVQGECWHNNHHAHPNRINYGEKWWELDPTYFFIKIMKQ